MAELYQFKPMLGPAEEFPVGSIEWAERMSNRLQLGTRSVTRSTAHSLRDLLKAIWRAEPRPWDVWPKGRPFGTPEDYSRKVTGHGWKALVEIVKELTGDGGLDALTPEEMLGSNGRAEAEVKVQGRHATGHHRAISTKRGSTERGYLLRRLARDHEDILARYEAGNFKSVREAAKAAGIIKESTPFEQVMKLVKKLSANERRKLGDAMMGLQPDFVGPDPDLIGIDEACAEARMSRSTLYRKVDQGEFPSPRKIARKDVWPRSEVRFWTYCQIDHPMLIGLGGEPLRPLYKRNWIVELNPKLNPIEDVFRPKFWAGADAIRVGKWDRIRVLYGSYDFDIALWRDECGDIVKVTLSPNYPVDFDEVVRCVSKMTEDQKRALIKLLGEA